MVIKTPAGSTDSRDAITGHTGTASPEDVAHVQRTRVEALEAETMAKRMTDAERFFYQHAGYSYGNGETRNQGRRRVATELANAEQYAAAMDWGFCWEPDDEPWDGDCPAPRELLGCVVRDLDGAVLASLWGIGDPDPAYSRVVEAELALEAMPEFVATGGEIA